jgi:translation initiation factor 2 alpha subunit (eIF-2alpha)
MKNSINYMENCIEINNMNFNEINYYSTTEPTIDELVLVNFNNKDENAYFGELLEYKQYRCFMNYGDIVKKNKVKSWTKFAPLNKTLIVQVDEIDENKNIVRVSMSYLSDKINEQTHDYNLIQKKLMEYFNENNIMETFIKSFCYINKYDFKKLWTTLVYYIDELRREQEDYPSLWVYFNDNINYLENWIQELNLEKDLYNKLISYYEIKNKETEKKIVTKIGIISLNGVNDTKKILSNVLKNIKCKYLLYYDTTPFYIFETYSNDSNIDIHNEFINNINNEIKQQKYNTYIKVNFIGKIYNS